MLIYFSSKSMFRRASIPQTLRGASAWKATALYSSKRWCVTPPPVESDWASSDFYTRLGLTDSSRGNITTADIRKQYKLLVKVYHPDMSGSSNASDTAFKNIKEAYETLSNDHKRKVYDSLGSERYQEAAGQSGSDMSPEDFARRQAMRQAISGGLPIFLASVAFFVSIMIYHYRNRMVRSPSRPGTEAPYTSVGTSAISSIAQYSLIFLCISVFPRVLSAALMYLMHASNCLVIFSKEMQVNCMMMCTISPGVGKASKDGTQLHNVRFNVSGLDPAHVDQSYMVMELQKGKPAEGQEPEKETLVFAPGVHDVTLPLQLNPNNAAFTYSAHIQIINQNLKLTLMDKTCELSAV